MNLKKLEVYGFKSFADKIELPFDYGITGIVGPNGCGKSNVADTIRWVLGEQSAKMLRGKGMQDLIFNGTEHRKSMSYCEASMYFDNKDRIFPIEFDEVVISRKLYRTGESEYLLNRNKALLKDITALLREAGLGREGYSIVGQGRIDAILNSKPEDRRAIFEEALGISKFRAKKVETERKLERTRDNMRQSYGILEELERQLAPLKKQSADAKKYLELRDALKYHEVNTYIYNYDNASKEKDIIRERMKAIDEEYTFADSKYVEAFQRYEQALQDKNNVDRELNELKNKELDLTVGLERQSGEGRLILERMKNLKEQNERLTTELQAAKEEIDSIVRELDRLEGEKQEKQQEHAFLTKQLTALNEKNLELIEQISFNQGKVEDSQSEVLKLLDDLTIAKSRRASLATEKETLERRIGEIAAEETRIQEKVGKFEGDKSDLTKEVQRLQAEQDALRAASKEADEALRICTEKANETAKKLSAVAESVAVDEAKLKLLQQVAENYDGFAGSVKLLMKDVAANASLRQRVQGVVANLVHVPKEYEIAIEVALGSAIQNVVTKDEEDAKYIIRYLKQNKFGRITFLPLTSVKPKRLEDRQILKEPGCLGVAADLVSFDDAYRNVFLSLLGSTVVVENIDVAVQLSRKYRYQYRLVTLEGDMILPSGSISGGSRKSESNGLLSHDREIAEMQKKVQSSRAQLAELQQTKAQSERELHGLQEAVEQNRSRTQNLQIEMATTDEKIRRSNALTGSERERYAALRDEAVAAKQRISEIAEEAANNEKNIQRLEELKVSNNSDVSLNQGEYKSLKERREKLQEEITSLRLKIAGIVSNLEAEERQKGQLETRREQLERTLAGNRKGIENNLFVITQFQNEYRRLENTGDEVKQLEEVKAQILNVDQRKEDLQKAFSEADRDRDFYTQEIQRLKDNRMKEEYNLERIDTDIEALQEKIQTDYDLTYSSAMRFKDENYNIEDSKKEITKYRAQIARLGYVNVNAIEDYASTEERYKERQAQMDDLKQADEDLSKVIADLTKEMVARFNEGFEKINVNFGEIFKELFAGGHARLTVERDEAKEELDYGIEIEAQPPGKKLQNISLLSGGERTLTAAAILFAILKLRPMPFCVLDEIEAALDDANAERVAKYLRKFSKETQFLVITHKKPTMEEADMLYGVTMEEKGVSKIVSVQLTDAIKTIED